jgi:UDP-glucuronate decarboxylase
MPLRSPLERKNVLVAGGAGFLGSALCEKLVADANVICVDNLSTGSSANIRELLHHPSFEFVNADIAEPFRIDRVPELGKFDVAARGIQEIYNLACPVSFRLFQRDQGPIALSASLGTKRVFDLAAEHGASVCLASSSAVYGSRSGAATPVREDDVSCFDHLEDFGAYVEHFRFVEAMASMAARMQGVSVKIGRIFPAYGERESARNGGFVASCLASALKGEEIAVPAGETRASFVYVGDVADALIRLMGHPAGFSVVNIGSAEPVVLKDVADCVVRIAESSSPIRVESGPSTFIVQPIPDLARARELLGWSPRMPLEEGIRRTVRHQGLGG